MNDTHEDFAADAALFARLRAVWEDVDPVPADLVDRMVAAVAVADLSREYALLTLVEDAPLAATRGETDTLTLQFSNGTTTILLHVSANADGTRRVDGWVDGTAVAALLEQGEKEWAADAVGGRFAFDSVSAGMSRLRVALGEGDDLQEFKTAQFEI